MTTKNKQLLISESHDDLNRCTLCRKNLIHTTRTLPVPVHVSHSYTSYRQSPYVATFHTDPTELDEFTVLKKSAPDFTSQHGWVVRGARISFSPNTNIEVVCLSQTSVDE
jgi:hypothetical protein